jgi:hypothetical protein
MLILIAICQSNALAYYCRRVNNASKKFYNAGPRNKMQTTEPRPRYAHQLVYDEINRVS